MNYEVKEIYYTLQGEGANTGRPAIFCRFSGCNLWSGQEKDRGSGICSFCDTDFVGIDGLGGGIFKTAQELAKVAKGKWPNPFPENSTPFIVCTGGEPLLQLDDDLVIAFHKAGFEVAIETNGTRHPPDGVDWICVSPKAGSELVLQSGDELKLVFPQEGTDPDRFEDLNFQFFFLQPMDGAERKRNTELALRYCLDHPQWRLSLQTSKLLGIP